MIYFVCDFCKNKYECHLINWNNRQVEVYTMKEPKFRIIRPTDPCGTCEKLAQQAYDYKLQQLKNE